MEAFAILLITVPILADLITDLGFDLIWWGIVMVAVVEIGVITPPFGVNVFVLKAMAGADVPLGTVFRGVMPFVFSAFIKLALLVLIPGLALWLPSTMF
jgi:TRAP-type C4-dicarboxylate transport system permease large subunit